MSIVSMLNCHCGVCIHLISVGSHTAKHGMLGVIN